MNDTHRVVIEKLKNKALQIRLDTLASIYSAGSGHTGGSLGLADIFTALYFRILNHDSKNPMWEERDRLILSIGHVAPVHYAALAHAGYFPVSELKTLRKLGSRLQGHPGRDQGLPGLETSSGSLGQGLSIAVGMALAGKIKRKEWKVFSIHGDGEMQEGSIWEAAMSAAHHKLNNLVAIIDRNQVQIDGKTSEVMEIEQFSEKWKAFGWSVFECDGNDMESILGAYEKMKEESDQPAVMIAHTIMGKGVPSIEGDHTWHGKAPNDAQYKEFIEQLKGSNA